MHRLLFASRKPLAPHGEGGGETIAFDLLTALARTGRCAVHALGSFGYAALPAIAASIEAAGVQLRYADQLAEIHLRDGTRVHYPRFSHLNYQLPAAYPTTLARDDHYLKSLDHLLGRFAPDRVLLQGEGSIEAWIALMHRDIPTFLYCQNGFELEPFVPHNLPRLPRLLANSRFGQASIRTRYGREADLLVPAIDLARYRVPEPRPAHDRFTVLFINPVELKGLAVLLDLVDHFPDLAFLVLEGWHPIPPDLRWRLSAQPHVRCLDRTWDMAAVYAQADLLIVPSRYESFGRVVVEAHAAGLPTLASRVGGLPEAGGNAGLLVDDYLNSAAWAAVLRELVDQPERLASVRPRLEANARRFAPEETARCFVSLLDGAGP